MTLFHIIIKVLCFVLFCLLSAFVVMFGKNGTDIKASYVITAVFLLGVIVFL